MNREPIGLYIFRYVMGIALLGLASLLYWSSVLIEEDVHDLQDSVKELRREVQDLADQYRDLKSGIFIESRQSPGDSGGETASKMGPNLLREDPFFTGTLSRLLGNNFKVRGTAREATVGRPHNLHPLSNWSQVSSWNRACTVRLAKMQVGVFETLVPDMAIHMEEREDDRGKYFWIQLRKGVFWEPLDPKHFPEDFALSPHFLKRHPVTAHDFKFYVDAVMNPHVQEAGAAASRNYLGDIVEIRAIDDHTLTVRWRAEVLRGRRLVKYSAKGLTGSLRPLPRFVYQYFADGSKIVQDENYRENSIWAQNFSEHWARNIIVSCGPYIFDGMTDEEIRFLRNPNFYNKNRVLVEGRHITFKQSVDGVWQDFKAGKLDTYTLRPDQIIEFEDFLASDEYQGQQALGNGISRIDFVSRAYNYVGWNFATPFFEGRNVRLAMTLAIDRRRIIEQNLSRMAVEITGPFYRYSPSYDQGIESWPFDLQEARRLLEMDGWYDSDDDGIRDKEIDGKRVPFRFTLTYYVKNPTSKANCEYISTTLRELGIDCVLNGVDIADLSKQWDDKSFHAIYLGWSLGSPPEEPKQLWHSSGAKEKGSSNGVGFQNAEADSIIAKLQYTYSREERLNLYHRFHRIIHENAPYTFLYTPKTAMLYRSRVQNVFIPAERQDLIPGANVGEPDPSLFWLAD